MVDRNDSNKFISSSSANTHHDDPHTLRSSSPPLILQMTFLRHGQTTANAAGIVQGHQHFWPLNEIGVAQAKAAGLYLHNYYCGGSKKMRTETPAEKNCEEEKDAPKHFFWRAYASDLDRASSTAQIALLGTNGCNNSEQIVSVPMATIESSLLKSNETLRFDKRLREFALGAREGRSVRLSWEEAEAEARKAKKGIPLREFPEDVVARAKDFLEDLYTDAIKELKQQEQSTIDHPSSQPLRVIIVSHGGFLRTLFDQVLNFDSKLRGGKIQNASFTDVNVYYDMNDGDVVVGGGGENGFDNITATTKATNDRINAKRIVDSCQYRLGRHVNYTFHLKDLKINANESSKGPSLKNGNEATRGASALTKEGGNITAEDEMNDASVIE